MPTFVKEPIDLSKIVTPLVEKAYISGVERVLPPYIGEFSIRESKYVSGHCVESFYYLNNDDRYSISLFCRVSDNSGRGQFWVKFFVGQGGVGKSHTLEKIISDLEPDTLESVLALWRNRYWGAP